MTEAETDCEVFTSIGCPWCAWRSTEMPDIFRTRLTAAYHEHFRWTHVPPPTIHQRYGLTTGGSC